MTHSSTARRRGIDNTPSDADIESLRKLCRTLLEPIRANYPGAVVKVESALRSEKLNKAIGGAKRSAHTYTRARAADFDMYINGDPVPPRKVYEWIKTSGLPFDKVILEFPGDDPHDGWIHIQIADYGNRPRGECYIATKQRKWGRLKTVYTRDN